MISCVVATCGSDWWRRAGDEAAATVVGAPVIRIHDPLGTVAGVRNAGLDQVTTDFVCWLDADDSLTPDYFEQMSRMTVDIRQPNVPGWNAGRVIPPQCHHHGTPHGARRECLEYGNPFSPGAVVRTELALRHRWSERWPVLEDFAFWRSICTDPLVTVACTPAVYLTRTRRNPSPRNRSLPRSEWAKVGRQIAEAIPWPSG